VRFPPGAAVNPSALSSQLTLGLHDFLRVSFSSTTPGMDGVIERLIAEPGAILKGPYVSVNLPFEQGTTGEFFPDVPLGFPAHRHQVQAFQRLSATQRQNTSVATGTGSGKTESFLWPILDACLKDAKTPGIKAILIYPMNALATDQAERIAKAIHRNPALKGVRAGLYIGQSKEDALATHKSMGPDHIITDRKSMQVSPPDILLTNYKMLDYLLIRPGDQDLWQHNKGKPLQFLVVDELHTFDGAQGTDLGCLIRRLKDRLQVAPGTLACV
jgi:DEAD/DEAH box helicase domain-containing protein